MIAEGVDFPFVFLGDITHQEHMHLFTSPWLYANLYSRRAIAWLERAICVNL